MLTPDPSELAAYQGQTVVIKIGGNSIDEDPAFLPSLAEQCAFLQKINVRLVIVHGGGPQIDRALKTAGIDTSKRADGRRPTSPAAIKVVEQVMRQTSEAIAQALARKGCAVFSAAGSNQWFVNVEPFNNEPAGSGNRAGMPTTVNTAPLAAELQRNTIVVLHCLGRGPDDLIFNTNADDYAMAIAVALNARRLVLATNVDGVLDDKKRLIEKLTPSQAQKLFENGAISGGMIPKVENALRVLQTGVGGVAIINAHHPKAILTELLTTKGLGTLIAKD